MRHLSPANTAITLGSVMGLWHLGWSLMVRSGVAKPVLDYVLGLHFLNIQYELAPFSVVTAITLVALTFAIGAVIGLVFALIWNWLSYRPGEVVAGSGQAVASSR